MNISNVSDNKSANDDFNNEIEESHPISNIKIFNEALPNFQPSDTVYIKRH
jgi:hypothetical protein